MYGEVILRPILRLKNSGTARAVRWRWHPHGELPGDLRRAATSMATHSHPCGRGRAERVSDFCPTAEIRFEAISAQCSTTENCTQNNFALNPRLYGRGKERVDKPESCLRAILSARRSNAKTIPVHDPFGRMGCHDITL